MGGQLFTHGYIYLAAKKMGAEAGARTWRAMRTGGRCRAPMTRPGADLLAAPVCVACGQGGERFVGSGGRAREETGSGGHAFSDPLEERQVGDTP